MRKKVGVGALQVGMYLTGTTGSWLRNPFWRNNFVLQAKDIAALRASQMEEVWIDTSKGADVAPAEPDATTAAVPLADTADSAPHSSFREECERAQRICAQGREAVRSMFEEARLRHVVDVHGAAELVQEISESVARDTTALISLARIKTADDYTFMHSMAVCAMMIALARDFRMSEADTRAAGMAGLLHDIGKVALPHEVLNKPGQLTAAELAVVRRHPRLGHNLLVKEPGVGAVALDVCLHHHERFGGGGYPEGLRGEAITLFARMGAVCDVYDAVTSNRPYKAGWDPAESMRMMGQWTPDHFDPAVFAAFTRSLGIYPVGSLVRLNSGRLGVVAEQCADAPQAPIVHVFFSMTTQQRQDTERIDLSAPGCSERIVAREDPARWKFPDLDALWLNTPGTA